MAGFSTYAAGALLNWLNGSAAVPDAGAPLDLYIALFDGDPGNTGSTGIDVTETIRPAGRVAVSFGAVAAKAIENDAVADFGAADAGADVTHIAVYDDATAGNLIYTWALDTARTVQAADAVSFAVGDLSFTLTP